MAGGEQGEACPDPSKFEGIVGLLGFFARRGKYGVLDRIGHAQSPEPVITAIYEAMRTVNALAARPTRVRGRHARKGEEVGLTCIDYDTFNTKEDLLDYCQSWPVIVDPEQAKRLGGEFVCCYTKPRMPTDEELREFFRCLKTPEGVSLAKQLATLAFAPPERRREESGEA